MFYRPKFCCNCGEKIERTAWKLSSSRMFCDLCSTEFVAYRYLPIGAIFVVLLTVIALGGIFRGDSNSQRSGKTRFTDRPENLTAKRPAINSATPEPSVSSNLPATVIQPAARPGEIPPKQPNGVSVVDSPAYFCGAATKKGTPCTRRVKGNTRCWQHSGQPSMLPSDKLRAQK